MPDEPSPAAPSRDERERMLAEVKSLIWSLVRRSGLPSREDQEDAAQEMQLLVWQLTEKWDPTRGTKFSTYAHTAIARALNKLTGTVKCKVMLQMPDEWDAADESSNPAASDPPEPDTEGQLFDAVQRQLAGGLLDALDPRPPARVPDAELQRRRRAIVPREMDPRAVLPQRRIAEAVGFEGLTCDDLAAQAGHPVKSVRANLKGAIRKLQRKGLTQHVATDAEVEAVLVPDPVRTEQGRACRARRRQRRCGAVNEPQEPACPVTPAEAAPCPTPLPDSSPPPLPLPA